MRLVLTIKGPARFWGTNSSIYRRRRSKTHEVETGNNGQACSRVRYKIQDVGHKRAPGSSAYTLFQPSPMYTVAPPVFFNRIIKKKSNRKSMGHCYTLHNRGLLKESVKHNKDRRLTFTNRFKKKLNLKRGSPLFALNEIAIFNNIKESSKLRVGEGNIFKG